MAMPKLDFDFVEDLKTAGASHELAQAILRVVSEKQVAQLATKADVADLRTELVETREVLRTEMAGLRGEMAEKMAAIQTRLVIWMIGTALGIVALVAGILQLMK